MPIKCKEAIVHGEGGVFENFTLVVMMMVMLIYVLQSKRNK